jgi:hypothetical protein
MPTGWKTSLAAKPSEAEFERAIESLKPRVFLRAHYYRKKATVLLARGR